MNRNNFLPHVALALVIILIAAFAGKRSGPTINGAVRPCVRNPT